MDINKTQTGSAILDRLVAYLGLKTDAALAKELKVSRATLSSWRSRGAIPIKRFMAYANRSDINLNWLILGEGPQSRGQEKSNQVPQDDFEANIRAQGRALEEEWKLGDMANLAKLGMWGEAWAVSQVLLKHPPEGVTLETIHEALSLPMDRIQANISLLIQFELVEKGESNGLFRLTPSKNLYEYVANSIPDINAQGIFAMEQLSRVILPAVQNKHGGFLILKGTMPNGYGKKLAAESKEWLKQIAQNSDDLEGDEVELVTILFGLAYQSDRD